MRIRTDTTLDQDCVLKATVQVCTACMVVSLLTTRMNFNTPPLAQNVNSVVSREGPTTPLHNKTKKYPPSSKEAEKQRAAAPLVDTRTIGKSQHSLESTRTGQGGQSNSAHLGSANPKSIEALRWAEVEEIQIAAAKVKTQSFEDHNPQLCLALALLCIKEGLEARRGLNATYDSNKGQ